MIFVAVPGVAAGLAGQLDEDPLVFALTDRMSQLIGVAVARIEWLAA